MQVLAIIIGIYGLGLIIEALVRLSLKRYNVLFVILTLLFAGALSANAWLVYQQYQQWQLATLALLFMVVGVLPQLYDLQQKQTPTLIRHAVQFFFHLMLIILLFGLSQK